MEFEAPLKTHNLPIKAMPGEPVLPKERKPCAQTSESENAAFESADIPEEDCSATMQNCRAEVLSAEQAAASCKKQVIQEYCSSESKSGNVKADKSGSVEDAQAPAQARKHPLPAVPLNRNETFLQPRKQRDILQSLKYSADILAWMFYHSVVIGLVPISVTIAIFLPLWFIEITNENLLIHFFATYALFTLSMYFGISIMALYVFGKERVFPLLLKLTMPMSILHIAVFYVREIFQLRYLAVVYYCCFLFHCILIFWHVKRHPPANPKPQTNQKAYRFEVLSSDGTPMALFKGFIAYGIVYNVSVFVLIPYFMKSGFVMRVIGRVAILPFVFNLTDTYQNNQLIYKSKEHLRYRIIFGNVYNFIGLAVLRLMITDSPNLNETFLMALASGASEVFFRATFVIRAIYVMRLLQFVRKKVEHCWIADRKVLPLDNILESGGQSASIKENTSSSRAATETNSMHLTHQFNHMDNIAIYITAYRSIRSYYTYASELQIAILIPLILFICRPAQDYFTFEVIESIQHMLYSIAIQLSIELLAQIISITTENYIYGLEIPIVKSWKYNMKPFLIFQTTLVSFTMLNLFSSPFWKDTENWPDS